LDAAERLMAERGYGSATVAALVGEAGVPASSVYHYFNSKEGVLLAVMERGAERFFEAIPELDRRQGRQAAHLSELLDVAADALEQHPDFLRILVVMAAQPPGTEQADIHRVVNRVREMALDRLRTQMEVVFGLDPNGPEADYLARFALAVFDGAFVAQQTNPERPLRFQLRHLPAALIAVRRDLA
jgi:AcrR family transcriptional regulator